MYISVNKNQQGNYEVTPNVNPTPTPVITSLQGMLINSYEEVGVFRGVTEFPDTFWDENMWSDDTEIWKQCEADYNSEQQILVCSTLHRSLPIIDGYTFMKIGDSVYGWYKDGTSSIFRDEIEFTVDNDAPTLTATGDGSIIQPGETILPSGETIDLTMHEVSGRTCYYFDYRNGYATSFNDGETKSDFLGSLLLVSVDFSQYKIAFNKYVFIES